MSMTERKDLRIEGEFIPLEVEDLIALRTRVVDLVAAGEIEDVKPKMADSVANGITGWLVAKASGDRDTLAASTRSRYRRVLTRLDELDPEGGQRGSSPLRQVLGLAAAPVIAPVAIVAAMVGGQPLALLQFADNLREDDLGGYVELAVAA